VKRTRPPILPPGWFVWLIILTLLPPATYLTLWAAWQKQEVRNTLDGLFRPAVTAEAREADRRWLARRAKWEELRLRLERAADSVPAAHLWARSNRILPAARELGPLLAFARTGDWREFDRVVAGLDGQIALGERAEAESRVRMFDDFRHAKGVESAPDYVPDDVPGLGRCLDDHLAALRRARAGTVLARARRAVLVALYGVVRRYRIWAEHGPRSLFDPTDFCRQTPPLRQPSTSMRADSMSSAFQDTTRTARSCQP
jgi:hypothetical protein